MDTDAQDANTPVAKEILDYFLRNPEAADSLMEIARWRLVQENVRRSVEATLAAVDQLLEQGYLRQETRQGTERIFQLNPERKEAAEDFVQGKDGST